MWRLFQAHKQATPRVDLFPSVSPLLIDCRAWPVAQDEALLDLYRAFHSSVSAITTDERGCCWAASGALVEGVAGRCLAPDWPALQGCAGSECEWFACCLFPSPRGAVHILCLTLKAGQAASYHALLKRLSAMQPQRPAGTHPASPTDERKVRCFHLEARCCVERKLSTRFDPLQTRARCGASSWRRSRRTAFTRATGQHSLRSLYSS